MEFKTSPIIVGEGSTVWGNIVFDKSITIRNLVAFVLFNKCRKWSYFDIIYNIPNGCSEKENTIVKYRDGVFKRTDLYYTLKYKKIKNIIANWDWCTIKYFIEFE